MEYVPLKAALEYMVCPETGGGFVMGFEFEIELPLEQLSEAKMTAELKRAERAERIGLACMG